MTKDDILFYFFTNYFPNKRLQTEKRIAKSEEDGKSTL